MQKRILIIYTRYPHWGAFSGINQLVRYIDENKFQIEIQGVADSDDEFPIQNSLIRDWTKRIIKNRGMAWYKLSDLVAEAKALWRSLFEKVDLIHFLDGEHSAQFLPPILKILHKQVPKIVATYHQPPEVFENLINKDVISKLDFITVVSPEQLYHLRRFVEPHKISLILHGIDSEHFRPLNVQKDNENFKCITVGHWLRDFKTVRIVAENLRHQNRIEFHIVSKMMTKELTQLENVPNVKIHRDIDDANLLKLYQQSDLLFCPLIQSTANNALLEAIACGLPVLSSYLTPLKTYLPGTEAILISENDPKQFIDSILDLANRPDKCKTMSLAARKRAVELDWSNIAPMYEEIYSRLIKSSRSNTMQN